MPRPWTLVLAVAALTAGIASTLVIIHKQPVPQAGQIVGYVPPSASPTPSPSPTPIPPLTLADPKNRALEVSIVGDSLVVGKFASGPTTRNRNLILGALHRRGSVTAVEAFSTGASTLTTAVTVPSHLDLVVLELGTDDSARVSPATFARYYDSLVGSVRRGSPQADLVCAGTWRAGGAAYDAVIEQACVRAGGRFVSLQSLYAVPSFHGPAGVSGYYGVSTTIAPNNAGHRAIARVLLAAVGISLP